MYLIYLINFNRYEMERLRGAFCKVHDMSYFTLLKEHVFSIKPMIDLGAMIPN